MKFFKLWILYFLPDVVVFANSIHLVANTVNSIADFFLVNCIYLIGSSRSDLINQQLWPIFNKPSMWFGFNYGKSIAFSNFSEYFNLIRYIDEEQCQVPLRTILQLNESTTARDFEEFNLLYMDHGEKIRSGVWMIFTKSFDEKFIVSFFRKIFLPFDIKVLVAWIHDDVVHLKEVYQVAPSHVLKQNYFGNYSFQSGLIYEKYIRFSERTDLEGLKLKVGYIEGNLPFTAMKISKEKIRLEGFFGEIWHTLEHLMNISSTYVKVNLQSNKEEDKNSWLKMLKMLKQKKIDIGLGDFIQSTSRIDSVDFSHPLLVSNFQVFYRRSLKNRSAYGHFIPFDRDIWLALVAWAVITSFCHFCITRLIICFTQKKRKIISMPTSVFMTIGGLCGQGWSNCPRLSSCRVLFLLNYIVATVVIPAYTASLTRYLTSKPVEFIIKDLNDLYTKGSHKVLVVDGSYEYYFFNFSRNEEHLKKIHGEKTEYETLPKTHKEAIILMCKDVNTAVFTATSTMTWELNKAENQELKDDCKLSKMAQDAGILLNGIIYTKNSRFRKAIDNHLKNLQSSGILGKIQQKYWRNQHSLKGKRWESVSLKNSSAVFHIILSGFILSLTIVILEHIIKNRLRKV